MESAERLVRTPGATLMTVLVIAIALLLPGLLGKLDSGLEPVADSFQDSTKITLFLVPGISDQNGLQLSEDLLEQYGVSSADYISSAAALAEFRTRSGFDSVIDELERNPLPASITIVPQAAESAEIETMASTLQNLPEVEAIRIDLAWIQRLSALRALIAQLRILLAFILSAAVLLIIGNTIRMNIENRSREIEVLKLVGGTPGFIARPFLYCGLLLGAAGGLMAGLMMLSVQILVSAPVDNLLSLYGSEIAVSEYGPLDILLPTVTGAALGWFGAFMSVLMQLYSAPP